MVYVKHSPPPDNGDGEDSNDREFLTIEQAANYVQVRPSAIRSLLRQGKLKGFRPIGKRKILIRRSDLLKFFDRG